MKEHGDLPLVSARDDEGNGFNYVYFTPTYGTYDGKRNGEFHDGSDSDEEDEEDGFGPYDNEAVCIN